jgi:DNA-directed RNA polymerase subunit omega
MRQPNAGAAAVRIARADRVNLRITMIDALKSDEIVQKMGGRFKLTALVQRRLKELLIDGARPLVERRGRTDLELVIEEIMQEKIAPDWSETGYHPQKNRSR